MNHGDLQKSGSNVFATLASELLVATSESADPRIDKAVGEVLTMLRQLMKMDAAFVAEFVDGQRVFRHVDAAGDPPVIAPGLSDPLEKSWCQRVVDGRLPQLIPNVAELPGRHELPALPFAVGTHLSTPVVLPDGKVYGTLCCFSFSPNETINSNDLMTLQAVAEVLATHVTGPAH